MIIKHCQTHNCPGITKWSYASRGCRSGLRKLNARFAKACHDTLTPDAMRRMMAISSIRSATSSHQASSAAAPVRFWNIWLLNRFCSQFAKPRGKDFLPTEKIDLNHQSVALFCRECRSQLSRSWLTSTEFQQWPFAPGANRSSSPRALSSGVAVSVRRNIHAINSSSINVSRVRRRGRTDRTSQKYP